jgi:type VI secretion system protein ImpL
MKRVVIGILIFVVYLACVIAAAFALHFSGSRFALFCLLLGLLGAATIAFVIWYMSSMRGEATQDAGPDSVNLDTLLRDANRKLRTSPLRVKFLAAAQIIYIVGEDNSAKTHTVLQSGLDAELLAGNLLRDGVVAPTQLANIWLAGSSVIVEAAESLLQQPALWHRLIKATRPGKLSSLFAKAGSQPSRAVVVCVSAERIPGSSEAGYNADQIRASAQTLNSRLRQVSQTLGISVPVYVLFTKLDTLAHFADYVGRLSSDEVKAPLGSLVAHIETGSGLYAERASALLSTHLDELTYALSEFRLEVLARGGELKMLASAYEFPRDLQKRRSTIVDFLVELTRPSQLGINPFLRGFFFSGMRALIVEEAVAAVQRRPETLNIPEGATSVFSIGGAQFNQPRQQAVQTRSRKIAQWAFLPHLFSKLLLGDKSALEASRASTKVNLLKRALLGFACSCIFIYIILLTISFFNNRDLEKQVAAAAAVSVNRPAPTQFASVHDLQKLDQLGALLLKLDAYRKDGPPLMDRWGLYSGEALYPIVCNAYSIKFRTLLLGPAQSNILTQLRALQSPPTADADYTSVYNPLKAYLITTVNPGKSVLEPAFLAPALSSSWARPVAAPSDVANLARTQFETYATVLAEPLSCMASVGGSQDRATVEHAREYLNGMGGFRHVYQRMLGAVGIPSITYNSKFAGSARFITNTYEIAGAFTKPGFAFMENAIQHPADYFKGEEWVVPAVPGATPDLSTLPGQLQKQYVADYLATWRGYMNATHFTGYQSLDDAAAKLDTLSSPSSPILELFWLISSNTTVALPEIAEAFKAPQAVVPGANPSNVYVAPGNQPYIQALQTLKGAIQSVSQNPATANDPTPILQAATTADSAAANIRSAFAPDPVAQMDTVSYNRLEDPITSIRNAAKRIPAAGADKGGREFCSAAGPVLQKFPFNPKATAEASPDEVAQIFSPGQALTRLTTVLAPYISLQSGQYGPAPSSAMPVNPAFLHFLNAAQKVSSALFPAGGTQPTLTFSLTEVKSPSVPDLTLSIDGQQIAAGQSATFHWIAQPASRITLTPTLASEMTGNWSVFKLGFLATHPTQNQLEYSFSFQGHIGAIVRFDSDGPGAPLLDPHFMERLHCVSTVVKP